MVTCVVGTGDVLRAHARLRVCARVGGGLCSATAGFEADVDGIE